MMACAEIWWSQSEYSACSCPLHQFTCYACLHRTGQVVRYTSLRLFTLVGRDMELDNMGQNKYNLGLIESFKILVVGGLQVKILSVHVLYVGFYAGLHQFSL